MRINAINREQAAKLIEDAKARGLSQAEVLDRGGFLLTQERIKEIQARAISDVVELLESTTPHQYTRKNTPNDLQVALAAYLREMAKELRK